MPRRTKVERGPIITMLAETNGDAVETARRLGLHYNTVNQIKRLNAGLCMSCGKRPHQEDRTKCIECAERERKRTANKRSNARKKGQCSMCPKKLRKGSTLYCEEHYRQTFARQRIHRVTDKYGAEAVDVLHAANDTCQVCGATRDDIRIDIHHIDQNQANGSPENLIVICQSCHWITHRLIASRDRVALLAWFEKTYPQHLLR